MQTRTCALYGRVSTVRQAMVQDGGLDTQFDLMERRVRLSDDADAEISWTIYDRYREEGWSGKNLERPEFRRMMADIEAGRVNTVVVHKIDRISRSLRDFLGLWETFERLGVQFLSLRENFDTTSAIGRAMLKLVLVFAELEREQTGERTSATLDHRARQGLWNGGRLFGYDLDPEEKGVLKVNPEEARLVRQHVFEKCVELGSAGKVVRHLHEVGIRVPTYESRRGKTQGGGSFTKPAVIRMLQNPAYLGKIRWKDELYDARHDGIIPQELFDKVQRILAQNRKRRTGRRDQRAHVFLLQGLIRCGQCGSFMTPKTSTGRGGKPHFYYQCTKNAHSAGTECDARYVPANAAEEYVLAELRKWAVNEDEIRRAVEEANRRQEASLGGLAKDRKAAQRRLREVLKKIEPIVKAVEAGSAVRSFEERLKELEGERKALEEELARIEFEEDRVRQHTLSVEAMAATYRTFPEVLDELQKGEEWKAIKDLIGRYVEVLDWHQDRDDAGAGTVDIMLFEQEKRPSREEAPVPVGQDGAKDSGGASEHPALK